jgi:hypothetical protein
MAEDGGRWRHTSSKVRCSMLVKRPVSVAAYHLVQASLMELTLGQRRGCRSGAGRRWEGRKDCCGGRHSGDGFVVRRQGKGESVRVGGFVARSGPNGGKRCGRRRVCESLDQFLGGGIGCVGRGGFGLAILMGTKRVCRQCVRR